MKTLIAFASMIVVFFGESLPGRAGDEDLRGAYQLQLNRFLIEVDGKVGDLSEKLDLIFRLNLSPCLLEDWLKQFKSQMARGNATFDDLFLDKIDEHLRVVKATEDEITAFVKNKAGELNELDKLKIRELSIMLAANEMTSRTIKNQVLPQVYRRINDLSLNQQNSDELIRSIRDAYRSDFESLCARLKALEDRINRGGPADITRVNEVNEVSASKTADNSPRVNGGSTQQWQPDAYVTSISHLCPNAKLVATSYTFYARVHRGSGVVLEEKFGDVYSDCQGKVVLLLRNFR